ncbi:PBP1A family penicillin-binding protein [Anaerobacillus isosaccharinicus]|uniref:Penicillin-binding protein n=1 Tax=Anaerobacillus isosaccharinicus TaxID=1532552 RepID=A0A1S2KXA7_9BACI|nr:penicillin-binding protein 1A [Anaerobacillus isosaccharinicus]MBA5585903.1 PBP1A family penicillin-binding protein [Anaerobacillus isosaccharinicus]QOY35808.1 PBP1A family penicillin-binding protein [Anaerobacillus isosaccharinicus]
MSEDTRTRQGRRKVKETNKNSGPKKGTMKKVLIAFSIFMVTLLVAGVITVFSIIKDAPDIDPSKLTLANNPEIFDQNDEIFTTLSASENRRSASILEIPQLVEDAFISVEDVRFREHFGIDLRRIGGALRANVTGGFGAEGASTITQQVVKNLFLSSEKKITRKLQEQYLAIKLEQSYSKDQILELYLNAIFFSEGYGVVEAADRFFSKTLDELTIEDAALLAGIPQRPNFFNPFKNPVEAQKRRNIVITLMERHGKITFAEAERAKAVPIESQLKRSEKESYPYRAFLDQVLKEVEAIDGISINDVYTGGLKIYTTLDQEAQTFTEALLETDIIDFPDEFFQAGITVVDTKSGAIKAIGGGRQTDNIKRGFSWATDPRRSPGSTIKPILDYGPAIEHLQWSTYHQITDEPHQYSNGVPIRNFNNKYSGDVSMRYALQRSLNIPALKAFQEVGIDKAAQFGRGLGIPLDTIQEAYSLGGFTNGFSTLELAGAYAAFGNEGVYHKPFTVRKVVFPDGKTINLTPDSHIAMSDYTAFMVTDMLKSAIGPGGTGPRARVDSLPMAGKTGTSNFDEEEKKRYNIKDGAKDIWFAGFTTNYSIAVWTGYNTPDDGYIKYDGHSEHIAKYLFKELMAEISKGKETLDFKQPNSVVRVGVEKATGLLPSPTTPESEIIYEYFVRGTEPTEVSKVFAKPTTPQDFMGEYHELTDQIILTWTFPEEERHKFVFELQLSINDGPFSVNSLSDEMQHIIFNPESDATYRFKVTAVSLINEQLRSDPIELTVVIPKKWEEEEIAPEEPIIEIPNPIDIIGGGGDDDEDADEDEDTEETPSGN